MEFTAKVIAEFLKGEVVGNPEEKVSDITKIEEGKKGTLSFLANPKYTQYIYDSESSIVLVNKDFIPEKEINTTIIKVDNAYKAFASLLELYAQSKPQKIGVSDKCHIGDNSVYGKNVYIGTFAFIGDNVKIGDNVNIYPHVYIGDNVEIKDNTTLFSGVKIYEECKIGSNVIIHSSTVIGSDGFGFAPQSTNDYKKIPQIGNVILEDFVEIGSNSSIDRATMGSTIIRKGVKLDNLIQIAHNVEIDENSVIAAQTGVSGSTKVGKNCMIGGQVGIVGHINIADEVKIAAQSGIGSSIKTEGEIVQGSPSFKISDYQKSYVMFRKLPTLYKQINDLEKQLKELKEQLGQQ